MSNNNWKESSKSNYSQTTVKTIVKERFKIIESDKKVLVEINQTILNKIKFLCKHIAKVEWSGVLFYSVKGSISQPESMVCIIEDIFLMDKGTTTRTAYDFNQDVINFIEAKEERMNWRIGLIHSHNTMGVFFSSEDIDELQDNTPNHNYYLSLIVNNFMEMTAKIATMIKISATYVEAENEDGIKYQLPMTNVAKQMLVYNCIVKSPVELLDIDMEFRNRMELVIKECDSKAIVNPYSKGWVEKDAKMYYPVPAAKTPHPKSSFPIMFDDEEEDDEDDLLEQYLEDNAENFLIYFLRGGKTVSLKDTLEEALGDLFTICPTKAELTRVLGELKAQFNNIYADFCKNDAILDDKHRMGILDYCLDIIEVEEIRDDRVKAITKILTQISNGK